MTIVLVIIVVLAIAVAIIAGVILAVTGQGARKNGRRQTYADVENAEYADEVKSAKSLENLKYYPATLLTNNELVFFKSLQSAIGQYYYIFPKVRLIDVVKPGDQTARNKVIQKHVDFVLCHAQTFNPILVVELDDSSHASKSAQKRDEVKNYALASAGIPILRVTNANVDAAQLQRDVSAAIRR